MKNCPVCNEPLGDNAERCIKCNYEFPNGEYICSHCNKPLENAKSICECGGWAVTPMKKNEEVPSMQWTRAELKSNAKSRISSILMLSIIACLLLSVFQNVQFKLQEHRAYYSLNDFEPTTDLDLQIGWKQFTLFETSNFSFIRDIMLYGLLLFILYSIFILDPYLVGLNRFFMLNINGNTSLKSVLFGYHKGNYFSVVRKMFRMELKTLLWTLLFIIPGIVKSYEYMMIPYILSENPDIDTDVAFMISKKMMNGNKWNVFVLDLSFILWDFLSLLTLGIAGIVWVVPYKCATKAELYHKFRIAYLYYDYAGANQLKGYEE